MEITEENSKKIGKIQKKSKLFNWLFFCIFRIFSLFNLFFFHIFHIISLFDLSFFHIFHIFTI
jgi:hypothetical protein